MSRAIFSESDRDFLARMRVARLATADAAGQPHVIPVVFAADDQRLYTPVDNKPKRVEPRQLRRVRNLLVNPKVAVVVDHYDENWTHLAWVLVMGQAEILERGDVYTAGIRLLQDKYCQYEMMPLENRLLIAITPLRVTRWGTFPSG
jgi:coenzyme F420-0:L-glutamate ligase/coenzyme F420-1:gamma-L-glutamate ligase